MLPGAVIKYIIFKDVILLFIFIYSQLYNEHARSTIEIHYEYHSNPPLQLVAQNMS